MGSLNTMPNLITKASRLALFGVDMSKQKPTVKSVVKTKALNTGRRMIGLPDQKGHGWQDLLLHHMSMWWSEMTGSGNREPNLPDDLPVALFNAIDQTLRLRGGITADTPNFWCNPTGCTSTLFLWSIRVEYQPSVDPAKLTSMESAIESAISRAGYPYNVRIQQRAVVIEIDKPNPQKITMAVCWPYVEAQPINQRQALMGAYTLNGQTAYGFERLVDQNCSVFITGKPRSGKSQAGMSLILSLAMTNSPDSLSMILIDPKLIDFKPFEGLPHLAMPVISDFSKAAEVILMLSEEIDRRKTMVARGDKSFLKHSILIFCDELTDLFDNLDKHTEAKPNPVVVAWRRLAMVGGGYNIVVVGCTQRVFDLHIDVYSKLGLRIVGKQVSAGDSAAASGRPGTTANLLPGRGSFEVYSADEDGTRVQGAFVADSKLESYEKDLQPFFDSINARWHGVTAGWRGPGSAGETDAINSAPQAGKARKTAQNSFAGYTVNYSNPDRPAESKKTFRDDLRFKVAMLDEYWNCRQSGKPFSKNAGRVLHKKIIGVGADGKAGNEIYDWFFNECATEIAMIKGLEDRLEN